MFGLRRCRVCRSWDAAASLAYGVAEKHCDHVVALAGNPNTGKSTLFNALTGLRQQVGNWPGKTVVRAEGTFEYLGTRYCVVDLPGTYSLLSKSADEEIARDFLLFGRPSVTMVVADATSLERNLNLVLQVLEVTDRALVAVNLMDEAERRGLVVDTDLLSEELGVPAIPIVARYGRGLDRLLESLHRIASGTVRLSPHRLRHTNGCLDEVVDELEAEVLRLFPDLTNARWVALRLLEGDESVVREIRAGTLGCLTHPIPPEQTLRTRVL